MRPTRTLALPAVLLVALALPACTIGELVPLSATRDELSGTQVAGDGYGVVSIDAGRIAVGARGKRAAYVFEFDDAIERWELQAVLVPSSGSAGDRFGWGTDVSGERILVTAPLDDGPAVDSGAVYVYERDGGAWTETKLSPASLGPNDRFGYYNPALEGDALLVGAPFSDAFGADAGAVFAFEYQGGAWTLTQQFAPAGLAAGALFGSGIDIDGDYALISAPRDDGDAPGEDEVGRTYVYKYVSGSWQELQALTAPDPTSTSRFGGSVSASRGLLVAMERLSDDPVQDSGRAHLYRRSGDTYGFVATLEPAVPGVDLHFGVDAAITDDFVAVGSARVGGAVELFRDDGSRVSDVPTAFGSFADMAAERVDASGTTLVVGDPASDANGPESGRAFVIEYVGTP